MDWERPVLFFCFAFAEFFDRIFQQLDVLPIPDRGRQVMFDHCAFFAAPESTEQKDAAGYSRLSQPDPLIRAGHSEPSRPLGLERFRALSSTVPVSIGLHYGA